jgi:hypothetical protein
VQDLEEGEVAAPERPGPPCQLYAGRPRAASELPPGAPNCPAQMRRSAVRRRLGHASTRTTTSVRDPRPRRPLRLGGCCGHPGPATSLAGWVLRSDASGRRTRTKSARTGRSAAPKTRSVSTEGRGPQASPNQAQVGPRRCPGGAAGEPGLLARPPTGSAAPTSSGSSAASQAASAHRRRGCEDDPIVRSQSARGSPRWSRSRTSSCVGSAALPPGQGDLEVPLP